MSLKYLAENFIISLKSQLDPKSADLANFIEDQVYLNTNKMSFKGHEYQRFLTELITQNPGSTFVIKKPSQIGITTWAIAALLSRMALQPGESIIYAMPSASFSSEIMKTRIAPMIEGSPIFSSLIDRNVDSTTVKRFANGSVLYALGAGPQSNTALQSRPATAIISDELDKSDIDKVTGFQSRLSHTPAMKRLVLMFSTPTVEDYGIDAQFKQAAVQYSALLRCNNPSCLHEFDPDYYHHIKIPGYTEPLALLTRSKAAKLDLSKAFLECPNCGTHLDYSNSTSFFSKTHNPEGMAKKIGVALTPFCALAVVTPTDLVESSLIYSDIGEFTNQSLGKTLSMKDSAITPADIKFVNHSQTSSPSGFRGLRVTGIDMGKMCHIISGTIDGSLSIVVDQIHVVGLADFESFLIDLFLSFPPAVAVMDSQPYSSIVYSKVKRFPRLFSCIYTDPTTPSPELFKITQKDAYDQLVRQVALNKNPAMSQMARALPDYISFDTSSLSVNQHSSLLIDHLTSMRKTRDYRYPDPLMRKWVKTNGDDHLFHSLLYMFVASKLAIGQVLPPAYSAPVGVYKFKHKA